MSWVLHQLPPAVHAGGVLVNHLVELVAPVLVLGPRSTRRTAGALFVGFQVTLIVSGNLSFLNWLTIVPAIACFDDALLLRCVPRLFRARVEGPALGAASREPERGRWHRRVALGYALVVGVLSVGPVMNLLSSRQAMNASFDPLHLVNTYGAFGSVNRFRDELVIEGTPDPLPTEDARWEAYELPCKPGDVDRRPCLVSPYHYRLDWQMWFAAMDSGPEPWLVELVDKLLRGDRSIAPLLAKDPFPDRPPRFIRIRIYRYELTRWGSGPAWWKRRLLTTADRPEGDVYMRPMSLADPELEEYLRAHRLK
jgi:hypothetical protein